MREQDLQIFAKDPRFEPALQALVRLYESTENIAVFKDRCQLLSQQCTDLLLAVREDSEKTLGAAYIIAVDEADHIISRISDNVRMWSTWSPITALHQSEIEQGLEDLQRDLVQCAMRLNMMGNTLILKLGWADAFRRDSALCLDGRITIAGEYAVAGGGYADVWQGSLDGRTVAIKVMRPFTSEGRRLRHVKLLRRLWREYLVWSSLYHSNVLEYLGFSYDFSPESYVCPSLVSPWMSNGTVLSYLEDNPGKDRLELPDQLVGVAEGLSYLHSRKSAIVHGDLRAGNILVSYLGVPCLSDFGLSRVISEARGLTTSTELAGSLRWMSPELFPADSPGVSVYSDIWAYGMTVLEILSGQYPYFSVKHEPAVFCQIKDGVIPSRPEEPTVVKILSDEIWTICQQCWFLQPISRPSMHEVTARLCAYRADDSNAKHLLPYYSASPLATASSPGNNPGRPLSRTPLLWTVTSQLHQAPKSPSGGLFNTHATAFVISIELVLTASRSSTPARVSGPMKAVFGAVNDIIDDVRDSEVRLRRDGLKLELEGLQKLRECAINSLSNLAAVVRAHAKSLGMNPVNDLDTAAIDVSNTVIEIAKVIHIRQETKTEQNDEDERLARALDAAERARMMEREAQGRRDDDMARRLARRLARRDRDDDLNFRVVKELTQRLVCRDEKMEPRLATPSEGEGEDGSSDPMNQTKATDDFARSSTTAEGALAQPSRNPAGVRQSNGLNTKGTSLETQSPSSGSIRGLSKTTGSPDPPESTLVPELLKGVSFGFKPPDTQLAPAQLSELPLCPPFPDVISLHDAPSPSFHIMATSWRHLVRLLAQLETRIEASVDTIARTNEEIHLRVVVQFVKLLPYTANTWRTILHLSLNHPVPRRDTWGIPNVDTTVLPYSHVLNDEAPSYLATSALAQLYVIPLTQTSPFPILPTTSSNLALYLQSAMRDSRAPKVQNDLSNGMLRLARIAGMCYPEEVVDPDKKEREPRRSIGGLFKRVVG